MKIKVKCPCQDCKKGLLQVRFLRMQPPSLPGSILYASKSNKMNQGGQRGHTGPLKEHTRMHTFRQ